MGASLRFRAKVGMQVLTAAVDRLGSEAGCFGVNGHKSALPRGPPQQDLSNNSRSNQIHRLLRKKDQFPLITEQSVHTKNVVNKHFHQDCTQMELSLKYVNESISLR